MKKIIFILICCSFISTAAWAADPFGSPPKGAIPNCGPEQRYKFDVIIESREDFLNFLKNNKINNPWVVLDNFKEGNQKEINWDKVRNNIVMEKINTKEVYVLNYNPFQCSGFTLKMTHDGNVSVYGCCGE